MSLNGIDLTENNLMHDRENYNYLNSESKLIRIPSILSRNNSIGPSTQINYGYHFIRNTITESTSDIIWSSAQNAIDSTVSIITDYSIISYNEDDYIYNGIRHRRNDIESGLPRCLKPHDYNKPKLSKYLDMEMKHLFRKDYSYLDDLIDAKDYNEPNVCRISTKLENPYDEWRSKPYRHLSEEREDLLERAPIIEKSFRTNLNRSVDWAELELSLQIAKERLEEILQN